MARKAYTQELDDVASWFRNCGIDELTPEMVSNIILGWRPESVLDHKFRPTKRAAERLKAGAKKSQSKAGKSLKAAR